jgi:hypothetical protein
MIMAVVKVWTTVFVAVTKIGVFMMMIEVGTLVFMVMTVVKVGIMDMARIFCGMLEFAA